MTIPLPKAGDLYRFKDHRGSRTLYQFFGTKNIVTQAEQRFLKTSGTIFLFLSSHLCRVLYTGVGEAPQDDKKLYLGVLYDGTLGLVESDMLQNGKC